MGPPDPLSTTAHGRLLRAAGRGRVQRARGPPGPPEPITFFIPNPSQGGLSKHNFIYIHTFPGSPWIPMGSTGPWELWELPRGPQGAPRTNKYVGIRRNTMLARASCLLSPQEMPFHGTAPITPQRSGLPSNVLSHTFFSTRARIFCNGVWYHKRYIIV